MDSAQGKPITIPPINVSKEPAEPKEDPTSSTDDNWD
jgi:hypothetical protein